MMHAEHPAGRSADYSAQEATSVARSFDVDPSAGLSDAQAARRLARDGPNALDKTVATPLWRKLLAQFRDPLVYLLIGAVVVALGAWLVEGREGWPVDAVVIAAVLLVNAALGFVQESRAANAVAALAKMTTSTATVLREARRQQVPSADLVAGDVLMLEEGDAVGADARLLTAAALHVQEASLTGESQAVLKSADAVPSPAPLAERTSMVFKGTAVVQGSGRAIVTATGMATEMGSIAAMLEATTQEPTPLQREVARIGRTLGMAVIIIALVVVGTILIISDIDGIADVVTVLLLGVSLAVAAVPEGLPAILSLVLALGVQRMAARNAVVKKLSSVETLGAATVICSDKTGTLTRSEMTIQRIVTASGDSLITGSGYAPQGEAQTVELTGEADALVVEQALLLNGGSLANNAALDEQDGRWQVQGDPTEAAFLVAERKLGADQRRRARFERVDQIPFTSERKMMSTIERDLDHDGRLTVVSKGAPDVLIGRCNRIRIGHEVLPMTPEHRAAAAAAVERLSGEALRTLAVAYRPLDPGEDAQAQETLERDLIFIGTAGIMDPPREEAGVAIDEAHRAGIRVLMITGDHPVTAARIAAMLRITSADPDVLTGTELDAMDDAALGAALREVSVFARVAPVHKMRIVDALQADGQVVAMTGDGVNDAPALKAADIGIAMGVTGTEVTKEASRMILTDDNFATIVEAVREGRNIFDNIRKFLRYLLSSNMGEVLTVFLGVVGAGIIGLNAPGDHALVLPLLATQILWINLVTDSGPAIAMGVDPAVGDVMAKPPRRTDAPAIDFRMWRGVVEIGLVMAIATLLTIDLNLPGGMIAGHHDLDQARTAGFTVLVLAQLFNCFSARSETVSAFTHIFVNHWLWAAVLLSAALQIAVVHLDALNIAFGTVPLTLSQWLVCLAMASSVLWFAEFRKLFLRRGSRV
ncbi:cation-translocating P-type ATPase [Croceicoccus sp. F390]|uniref:Cation-translocating P-type ATPase n=1 Tax=Croceicoccus esteveae TaxID=3075597 RepID=A0ABU2ZIC0_9SPHN|nr:cation-translocating P-type ATPase [Croceicoccus sp. F390]MDT0575961.1 cation-translocating P-type ATPase [Croceicoccus sp. F390]